jgi:diguanylate cyclase (GGDEF)-like protein
MTSGGVSVSSSIDAATPFVRGRARFVSPYEWALWKTPRPIVTYILGVEVLVALLTAVFVALVPIDRSALVPFAVLLVCIVLYTEASRSIEQIREHNAGSPHVDLNSVWMFAAVLYLHPVLAAAVITSSYTYRWLRVRHHIVYRQAFSAAGAMLAGYAAWAVLHFGAGSTFADLPRTTLAFALVAGAGMLFLVINLGLITIAVSFTTPNPVRAVVLSSPSNHALEAATIALGAMVAWALADWPAALVLVVFVTLVLHSNVLIHQLREKARIDAKTGLLNAAAWTSAVDDELERATRLQQPSGLLVIDLDHFKAINDEYGHLAGDEMLRAVANTLTSEVRTYDIVGRFGGEEFVVLLPATSATETLHVAERIRRRIAELVIPIPDNGSISMFNRLTVSIGIAVFPQNGHGRGDVLHAADMAMYAAKAAGRNRVHQAVEPAEHQPL